MLPDARGRTTSAGFVAGDRGHHGLRRPSPTGGRSGARAPAAARMQQTEGMQMNNALTRIDFAAALGPTFTRNTLGLEGIYVPETPTETPALTVEDQQWIDACFDDHIRSSAAAGFQAQSRSEFQANFSRLALIHRETVATPNDKLRCGPAENSQPQTKSHDTPNSH